MRLYMLYIILFASIVIASIAGVPGLSDRLRRWLIAAVALFVVVPAVLMLLFYSSV